MEASGDAGIELGAVEVAAGGVLDEDGADVPAHAPTMSSVVAARASSFGVRTEDLLLWIRLAQATGGKQSP